jgi:hypothetical protein
LQLLAELLIETIEQIEGRGRTEGQHDGEDERCGCGVIGNGLDRPG